MSRDDHEIYKRKGGTNAVLGLVLGAFVLLVLVVTIVKYGLASGTFSS